MLYKIWINAFPFFNGFLFRLIWLLFRRDVSIGSKIRIGKHTSIRLYPSSQFEIGDNVKVCDNTEIAVINNATLTIGNNVGIGKGNSIICRESIRIGNDTILGPNVLIFDHNHKYTIQGGVDQRKYISSPISIGEKSWIGANVTILKGVNIGNCVTIGAGSLVVKDIPDNCIAVGNPCKPIKTL